MLFCTCSSDRDEAIKPILNGMSLQIHFAFIKRKRHLVHFFFAVFQKARDWTNGLRIKHCRKLWVRLMSIKWTITTLHFQSTKYWKQVAWTKIRTFCNFLVRQMQKFMNLQVVLLVSTWVNFKCRFPTILNKRTTDNRVTFIACFQKTKSLLITSTARNWKMRNPALPCKIIFPCAKRCYSLHDPLKSKLDLNLNIPCTCFRFRWNWIRWFMCFRWTLLARRREQRFDRSEHRQLLSEWHGWMPPIQWLPPFY